MVKMKTETNSIFQQKRQFAITSTVTMALMVIIAVFATLIAYRIPWIFDMTAGKIFTLSEQSQDVLAELTTPVEIIAIYPRDGADPMVFSLLNEYSKVGSKISVDYIDAEREPAKLASANIGTAAISNGTIIVRSSDKVKFVFAADMFQNTPEGNAFWGERVITGAIRYVTATSIPTIYFLEGHDEASITSELTKVATALELAVYNVQSLSLVKSGSVPQDAAMVIISSPRRDMSDSEYEALEMYMLNGGKVLFLVSPLNTNAMVLGNFNNLVQKFGLNISNNLVVEEDPYSHVSNNNMYLVPGYANHSITQKLAESKRYLILPISMGLFTLEVTPDEIKQEVLLASSPKSWMRTDLTITSKTQTGNDVAGPIPLAYAATNTGTGSDKGDSRVVLVGNATFIYNENLDTNANRDFFLSCVNWLLGGRGDETISPRIIGADKLIVRGSEFVRLVIISIILLPAIPFIGALMTWYLRKNQ